MLFKTTTLVLSLLLSLIAANVHLPASPSKVDVPLLMEIGHRSL